MIPILHLTEEYLLDSLQPLVLIYPTQFDWEDVDQWQADQAGGHQ